MDLIMSFWSEPYLRGFYNKWYSDDTFKLSWLLSTEAVSTIYDKPILYTDEFGADFLVGQLGLDFASVEITLDNLPKQFSRFYSLGRSYACSLQKRPFIHIDYDAYIFEKLPIEFETADLIFEKFCFTNSRNKLASICDPSIFADCENLPSYFSNYNRDEYNHFLCGIMGGNNTDFFAEYYNTIMDVLDKNENTLSNNNIRFMSKYYQNQIFKAQHTLDQFVAYNLSQEKSQNIKFILSGNNTAVMKYSHVYTDKLIHSDLRNRIVRRLLTSYPQTTEKVKNICGQETKIPTVDVVVIPNDYGHTYENVVRILVPRNIKADNVFVSNFRINTFDATYLSRLDDVRRIGSGDNFTQSLMLALQKSSSEMVVVVDGNVKVPRLYIEKFMAAYMEDSNSVYCAAARKVGDREFVYGAKLDDYWKNNLDAKTAALDNILVEGVAGGIYAFNKQILLNLIMKYPEVDSIIALNDFLKLEKIKIFCVKNIEVELFV